MPNIIAELPETYSSITRPVINQVVKFLIDTMRLPADTGIDFFGSAEVKYQPQSTLSGGVQNKFPFTGKINVEANEQYIEDRTLTTAVKRSNEQYVFSDTALGVYVKPVYVACEVSISFRYRAQDRVSAERWRDELRIRSSQGRAELLHEFDYHIPVPKEILVILHEIHRMREAVAPYGETLGVWLKKHLTKRATTLTTQAGTKPTLAIAERQAGVVGWFEFVAQPENGSKLEGAAWETGFDYKFQYDKVVANAMSYPVVIHNQIISSKFRQTEPVYQLINRARRPNLERHLLDKYTSLYTQRSQPLADNRLPKWDDWAPSMLKPSLSPLLSVLVGVGDDPRELLSLKELDEFEFDAQALNFLTTEYPWITSYHQSVIYIELYKWGVPVDDSTLVIDADLNLSATYNLNLREVYHVRINLVNDLTTLTRDALERLRLDGLFCLDVLRALYPKATLPELIGGKIVGWNDLLKVIGDATSENAIRSRLLNRRSFKTVGVYGIISEKAKG